MPIVATDSGWVWRFFLADATDDETAETGLAATAKVQVCAVGATTFTDVTASTAATELQRGWYQMAITSAQLGTEDGEAILEAYSSGGETDIFREKVQITDGLPADVKSNDVITGYRLSAAGVNDIRDIVIEGSYTLQHVLATVFDMMTSKSSGGGSKVQSYRNRADTLNRVAFSNIQTTTGDRLVVAVIDVGDLS